MGKPKLFLPLFGSTLLRLAVDAALEGQRDGPVIVVTGAYDREIREHLAGYERVLLVHNERWPDGMGSSLACGVKTAVTLGATHYLVTLADQPTMRADRLALLTEESRRWPDRIVATVYPQRAGVPAIFPAAFTADLVRADGLHGARDLIARQGPLLRTITFDKPPVDVDTPEDYAALLDEDA